MNTLLFSHAGEAHITSEQSFLHLIAAWYLAVPLFTILLTLLVALVIRHILDRYDKKHRKSSVKSAKKTDKKSTNEENT